MERRIVKILPKFVINLFKYARYEIRAVYWRRFHHKIAKDQIIKDLKRLGIKKRDVIFVHSSLKSLGFVLGAPQSVINALMETVGPEGTLAMPCFSLSGSMVETLQNDKVFDPRRSPSTVGAIPEAFRKMPGVYRSIHPTHSVCALGRKAKWITEGHENAATNFGSGTPLYKIMGEGGYIVGLGIEFGPVTFVHVIEDTLPDFPLKIYCNEEYAVKVVDNKGNEKVMKIKAHDSKVAKTRIDKKGSKWIRDFFTEYLTANAFLKTGYVGEAKCWIIKAKDLFEAQKILLKNGITIYTTEDQYRMLFDNKAKVTC